MSDAQVIPFRWRPQLSFNARLRLVRTEFAKRTGRTITQEEMAALLDEKAGTYKSWEAKGRPQDITEFARKVERVTGADPVWLLGLDGATPPGPEGPGGEYAPWDSNPEPADSPIVHLTSVKAA